MAYRNQNYITNRKIKEEVDKNQKGYSEEVIEEFEPQTYYFQSYDDAQGTTLWGSGTVQTTGVEENNFTQVKILTNDTNASFINQTVFVASSAIADATTLYPLYSDAGTTAMNIYVKISTSVITDEEPFVPITYQFISFGDDQGETKWGEGTVNTTGVENNGYTEVEVKTNSTDQKFVGQKFFIISSANPDGTTLYPLYTDAGTTSANIYVKINTIENVEG